MEIINVKMSNNLFDKQIPLMKPFINSEEVANEIKEILDSGWISQGPKVQEFESLFAEFVGARYAVATNSCTSAIHLALICSDVICGDEVILADHTCMADANAVIMSGATPVFADVDPKTFNITPETVEKKITDRTKAILLIDQIGLPCDIDAFKELAAKYNLKLIDDSAVSLGATYKGSYLGSHDLITTYSFHPRKMITTGEGGMLVTNDKEVAERARRLRATGASVSDLERHKAKGIILQEYHESGFNYRMTDMQAILGISQMKIVNYIIQERAKLANYYDSQLADFKEIECPFVPENSTHCYSSYCLKIKDHQKYKVKDLIKFMSEKNISCRFGIQPLHREPYFANRNFVDSEYPVSNSLAESTFFIPIFPGLKLEEQDYIIKSIKEFFNEVK